MALRSHDIIANMELLIHATRSGRAFDAEMQTAAAAIVDWLAARVPYKEPLPRGYSILWKIRNDANGQPQRCHQLLKSATGLGTGVWIELRLCRKRTFATCAFSPTIWRLACSRKLSRTCSKSQRSKRSRARWMKLREKYSYPAIA
jgi:hypothetical protein